MNVKTREHCLALTKKAHHVEYGNNDGIYEAHNQSDGLIMIRRFGGFGNLPEFLSVEAARALAAVLDVTLKEFDSYQAAMVCEYGPMVRSR